MTLLARELTVVGNAYLLAGIPVAAAWLAGRCSPMYRLERGRLCRMWGWMAVAVVLCASAASAL